MTIDDLIAMHRARPFKAFDICLADGRTVPVERPEFLGRSPVGRMIAVGLANGTHEIIDLSMVASLKPRNSSARRRRRK